MSQDNSDQPKSDSKSEVKTEQFKRKLTPFLAQEMLYDYVMGRLDGERKTAVEGFLKSDRECQDILEAIQRGTKYSDTLKGVELRPEILESLKESENVITLSKKYSSWREWPEAARWSITAICLTTVIAVVIAVIPWTRVSFTKKSDSHTVEIAQIGKIDHEGDEAAPEAANEVPETSGDEESGDDIAEAGAAAAPAVVPPVAPTPSVPVAVAQKPVPKPTPTPAPVAPPKATPVVAAAKPVEPAKAETEAPVEGKPKGFVYRAFMNLKGLDDIGPKITENIIELGGEKAGEVELGWKRGTGRYYHFALPEDNEQKLVEKLRAYGPVRISKDPHPRVMPPGKIRFILWVDGSN